MNNNVLIYLLLYGKESSYPLYRDDKCIDIRVKLLIKLFQLFNLYALT